LKKEIDYNDRIIVGVNKFQDQNDVEPKLNTIDPEIEIRQVKKLKEFKKNRDQVKVNSELSKLQKFAEKDDENLMPHIISAVKGHVTLGEISDVFVDIFGRYEPKFSF
jgi:methylmalonyl-CoA mutase N-terminal domain/subunit